jgi:hypothetical protein
VLAFVETSSSQTGFIRSLGQGGGGSSSNRVVLYSCITSRLEVSVEDKFLAFSSRYICKLCFSFRVSV